MIRSEKSNVTKANGRHPQQIEKVNPPKVMNRRAVDSKQVVSTTLLLYIASLCLAVGCIAGILIFIVLR